MIAPTRTLAIASPEGWWVLTTTETHLLTLDYAGESCPEAARTTPQSKLEQRLDCMLSRYFKGEPVDFARVPVQLNGTPFQNAVLESLRTVPYGAVRHYQWLAEASGNPKAVRAVGGALGRNPLPIVIPCHRIVAKNGDLGGFMRGNPCGPRLKSFLLKTEGVGLDRAMKPGFTASGLP